MEKLNIIGRNKWFGFTVISLLAVFWLTRYEIRHIKDAYIMKTNRWTGRVEICEMQFCEATIKRDAEKYIKNHKRPTLGEIFEHTPPNSTKPEPNYFDQFDE